MSRSGYNDDCDGDGYQLWRGAVLSAIRGKRGQKTLRELFSALNRMPVKELIAEELVTKEGAVCALGALGVKRKLDMSEIEPTDPAQVADAFGIAPALAQEIEYENDEAGRSNETPAERWVRMRAWVRRQLRKAKP